MQIENMSSTHTTFYFFSHHLSMVGLQPSSLMSTGCVVPLRGDWAIFCHTGSRRVGRVWSAKKKIPWNTSPWLGIEPRPRGEGTVRFIHFPIELTWLTTHYFMTSKIVTLFKDWQLTTCTHLCNQTWSRLPVACTLLYASVALESITVTRVKL